MSIWLLNQKTFRLTGSRGSFSRCPRLAEHPLNMPAARSAVTIQVRWVGRIASPYLLFPVPPEVPVELLPEPPPELLPDPLL